MSLTVMNPLESQVGGVESPLSIVLHCLGVGELFGESIPPWPRGQERCGLECHHRTGEETQSASVHLEPLQHIWRVEESHHRHPNGKIEIIKHLYYVLYMPKQFRKFIFS